MEKDKVKQAPLEKVQVFMKNSYEANPKSFVTMSVTTLIIFVITIIGFGANLNFNFTLIIFASLYMASLYLCISLGLSMTYKLLSFANFAHAEYFLVGAYVGVAFTYLKPKAAAYDILTVVTLGFIIAGLAAILGDMLVFKPLRKMNSSAETLMISSIGWSFIIRYTLSIFFGGGFEYYRWLSPPAISLPTFRLGGRNKFISAAYYGIKVEYIVAIIITAILVYYLFYILHRTKVGKAMRATSDSIDLAESSGINTDRMINITWFIGGGLAGVAGVIYSLTNTVFPNTGFLYLLPAFAVVVLGGIGSLKGSVYASLIVAFSQNISVSYLSWAEEPLNRSGLIAYQRVIPFAVLIFVILLKPQGLFGEELD